MFGEEITTGDSSLYATIDGPRLDVSFTFTADARNADVGVTGGASLDLVFGARPRRANSTRIAEAMNAGITGAESLDRLLGIRWFLASSTRTAAATNVCWVSGLPSLEREKTRC